MNALFSEDKFVTNKEFNMKKGKEIALKYAANSAWNAKISGPLSSTSWMFDFYDCNTDPIAYDAGVKTGYDVLEYRVESTILPDVYNAFVKPLAHPLGMAAAYERICFAGDFSEKVLGRTLWRSDGISVKCTHPSDTSPLKPPYLLLPWKKSEDFKNFVITAPIGYDPNDGTTWTFPAPYDAYPPFDQYIPEQPILSIGIPPVDNLIYTSAMQNSEQITVDSSMTGPWDPLLTSPEMFFATKDGCGLWEPLQEIDECQGNILIDLQYGYGEDQYSGYTFSQYIFENGAYLIQYECALEDGSIRTIIEYYRYDIVDASLEYNVLADDTFLPRFSYSHLKTANMVHGTRCFAPVPALGYPEACGITEISEEWFDNNCSPDDPNALCDPIKDITFYSFRDAHIESAEDPNDPDIIHPDMPNNPRTAGRDLGGWYGHSSLAPAVPASGQGTIGAVTFTSNIPQFEIVNSVSSHMLEKYIFLAPASISGSTKFISDIFYKPAFFYINGKLQTTDTYTIIDDTLTLNTGLTTNSYVEVIAQPLSTVVTEYVVVFNDPDNTGTDIGTTVITLPELGKNYSFHKNGFKLNPSEFEIPSLYQPILILTETVYEGDVIIMIQNPIEVYEHFDFTVLEFGSNEFSLPAEGPSIQIFVEGLKIDEAFYSIVLGSNVWNQSGAYTWDEDSNIINIDPVVIDVYTLVARYIQTRECIVNVYNLHQVDDPSIGEDFAIGCIKTERNIVHHEIEKVDENDPSTWIYSNDTNIINKELLFGIEENGNLNPIIGDDDENIFNNHQGY